ncbi:diguanylate cyclase (GGDEF)-like protein [Thermodesulfitimonas autotrophica]|uniref:Diguanylate cyclase (GGDEF)-like protein n=1 Tax=Thermodesulfitimonas autotrophica TaxID=1894989 RepID=A0A3N5AYC5_9THEO|nr:sensor domain-containing diguanylate cyclase [Thermodesulfitimonas autotrophica]RPF49933.1 diguanylate cyclase (GGDEF)-like protein [Thermodesulfitimonas autotrophica]
MQATRREFLYFSLFYAAVTLFGTGLYVVHDRLPEVPLHLAGEVLATTLSLGVFLVLWYASQWSERLEHYVLGVFFLGVAVLNLFYALSVPALPDFVLANSSAKALFFWVGGRLFAAAGLFCGGMTGETRRTTSALRYLLVGLGLVATAAFTTVAFKFGSVLGSVSSGTANLSSTAGNIELIAALLTGGAAVRYALKYLRSGELLYLMMVRVTGVFLASTVSSLLAIHGSEFFNYLAHIYKLVAFFLLFHAIFLVAVKEPFLRLLQVQENLRWVNENLDTLVSLRTADLRAVNERLRRAATTDYLTGALNRRYFLQKAQEVMLQAKVIRRPFSVLMMDIDGFKKINDTLGHQVGDQCLQQLVILAKANLRQNDVIGRYGGDEFAVLLPQADAQEAASVAERVIAAVAQNANPPFTISVGIASFPQHGDSVEEILAAADAALYGAKHSGRNQYFIYEPQPAAV